MKHFLEEGTHEPHLQGDKRSQQESRKRRKKEKRRGAGGSTPKGKEHAGQRDWLDGERNAQEGAGM